MLQALYMANALPQISTRKLLSRRPPFTMAQSQSQSEPQNTSTEVTAGDPPLPFTIASGSLADFEALLSSSTRILALLGAGLSAASGLPTFRGAGGMWKNRAATSLATPNAFEDDPGLVWQFYSYRRHMALEARPNPAHYVLAELARRKEGFLTLSQNVDGMC
jgi:NAD+-dependent protein deacetylase sirtuin 5